MVEQKTTRGTQLLDKALNIIDLVATSSSRPKVKDLVESTGYSKPTLYRILAALTQHGMLQVDGRDQAYELGLRFTELSQSFARYPLLNAASELHLRRLSDLAGETVSLGVIEGNQVRLIARHGPELALDKERRGGIGLRPLYCTGVGKSLLAFQPDKPRRQLLRALELKALTPYTITDLTQLEQNLNAVRRQGYGMDDNEIIEGVTCVSVPILNGDDVAVAALSISAPSFRMLPIRIQALVDLLSGAAQQISEQLRLMEANSLREQTRQPGEHSWHTRLFEPSGLIRIGNGKTIAVADRFGGCIKLLLENRNEQILWQGDEAIVFLGQVSGRLHFATAKCLLALTPDNQNTENLYQAPEGYAIMWGKQHGEGDIWLYLRSRLNRSLVRLSANGSMISEQRLHFAIRDLSIDSTGRVLALDPDSKTLISLGQDDALTESPQLLDNLPDQLNGEVLKLFHDPQDQVWLSASGSWSLFKYCPHARPDERWVSVPLPVPTAHYCLFQDGSERITIATGRYNLSFSTLARLSQAGDVFEFTPD